MKKFIKMVCVVFVGTLLFTGCGGYALNKEDTTVDTWAETVEAWKTMKPNEVENHITVEVSDTYRIDADIMIPDELDSYEVSTIHLSRHVYEDVAAVLEEWMECYGIEYDAEIEVREKEDELENGEMMKLARVTFGEEENSSAQVRTTYAIMDSPFSSSNGDWRLQNIYERQEFGRIHHEYMKQPVEEELITEEEILAIKEDLENIFEVEFLDDYTLYTCTVERIEKAVEWELAYMESLGVEADTEKDWEITEDDEGTILSFRQGYEGIPLIAMDPSKSETGAMWRIANYCQVVSSKDKIEGIHLLNPYDITGEAERVRILSFGEIMEQHATSRQGIETMVVNVGLYYLPIYTGEGLKFTAKPVWYVQMEMPVPNTEYTQRDALLYDAVTGEEIAW